VPNYFNEQTRSGKNIAEVGKKIKLNVKQTTQVRRILSRSQSALGTESSTSFHL